MNRNQHQLAYQEAAVRNASSVELVIILYDILARDLQGAIQALEAGKIEARTAKLKHGFLALQQLEGTLDLDGGGEFDPPVALLFHDARPDDESSVPKGSGNTSPIDPVAVQRARSVGGSQHPAEAHGSPTPNRSSGSTRVRGAGNPDRQLEGLSCQRPIKNSVFS